MAINSSGTFTSGQLHQNDEHEHNVNGSKTNGNHAQKQQIAVVGMACRFAGNATNPEKLWDLCASGRDAWSPIPQDRFDVKSLYHADKDRLGRNHAKGGYFLTEDVALFDAPFFGFTSDVADAMDPQLRHLLEVVYEATENAGIPIHRLAGPGPNTSVFTGCYTKDYHDLQTRDPETMPPSTLTGNYTAMFSNRISNHYDFQGASMSIDTGCSAGLAALHQGIQTIRSGESQVSIIAAANTILGADIYIAMSSLGMVGADGRCYAWDSRAQGYGRGEGTAALILKSLDSALRDGDQVHAVIRESGLNQDGKTATITSPSMEAQIRLVQDCYKRAGLDLAETGYVEAHMTGTKVGDATEAEALARTFGAERNDDDPIWIGSIKTNVGHTEGVSGLAGIIKAIMAMKHKSIPPNLNYSTGNPKIPLEDWRLRVPTSLVPWPSNKPLRASVNNFGYGGTNAHVILEAAPDNISSQKQHCMTTNGYHAVHNGSSDEPSLVFVLSAYDAATLQRMAIQLATHLEFRANQNAPSLDDIAFTLAQRRSKLASVATFLANDLQKLITQLKGPLRITNVPQRKQQPRLGFVFNGQGAQWHAMGRELLGAYPVFASAIDEADLVLRQYGADWSLLEELSQDEKSSRVSEIHLGQPITVALQICLVKLLHAWNIRPSAVTSHSSGEIAAAYAAGVLTFKQALGVTYWRGELARTLLSAKSLAVVGGMAACGVSAKKAEAYLQQTPKNGRVVVACVNGPDSVTLSGDLEALEEVVARISNDGLFARKLKVPLAYHSHHMMQMASAYLNKLNEIVPRKPSAKFDILYASPVTGVLLDSPQAMDAQYYVQNLTDPVLFHQAFESMCFGGIGGSSGNVEFIVEIGPHGTLSGPIRQMVKGHKVSYATCLQRQINAVQTMQELACELVRSGYAVDLEAVNGRSTDLKATFVGDLPVYPWNHTKRYWTESRVNKDFRYKRFPPHELLGLPVSGASTATWRNFLRPLDIPWLSDHRVDGMIVLPGAAYVSMAIEATRLLTDPSGSTIHGYTVSEVEFLTALAIPESSSLASSGVEVHLRVRPCEGNIGLGKDYVGWYEFDVRSLNQGDFWVENCRGLIKTVNNDKSLAKKKQVHTMNTNKFLGGPVDGIKLQDVNGHTLRERVAQMGIEYGPAFQGVHDGRTNRKGRAATDLQITLDLDHGDQDIVESSARYYVIHPTTLDSIIQATYTNFPRNIGKSFMVLPRSIRNLFVPQSLNKSQDGGLVVLSELDKQRISGFTSNVFALNDDGENTAPALQMDRLFCQAIPRPIDIGSESNDRALLFQARWVPSTQHEIPRSLIGSMQAKLNSDAISFEKMIIKGAFYFCSDALSKLEKENADGSTQQNVQFLARIREIVKLGTNGQLASGSKVWARASKGAKQKLFDEIRSSGRAGSMLVSIGQNLPSIIAGKTSASQILRLDDEQLSSQFHQSLPSFYVRTCQHVAKIASQIAMTFPGAKVLEIGGGAGIMAEAVLNATSSGNAGNNLNISGSSLIESYVFVESDSEMMQSAKGKLSRWPETLKFMNFDRQKDLRLEDWEVQPCSLDLVILSELSPRDVWLQQTLGHVRQLLKVNGRLIILRPSKRLPHSQVVLDSLPSLWDCETNQLVDTTKDLPRLEDALHVCGFAGIDITMDDCEDEQYSGTNCVITKPLEAETQVPSADLKAVIVKPRNLAGSPETSHSHNEKLALLATVIQAETRIPVGVKSVSEIFPDENTICIFACDTCGSTILDELDEDTFLCLQRLLLVSYGTIWLTCDTASIEALSPNPMQVQGLLRTARQEDSTKQYIHLNLHRDWTTNYNINFITTIVRQVAGGQNAGAIEHEFALRDDHVYVPRLFPQATQMTPHQSSHAFREYSRLDETAVLKLPVASGSEMAEFTINKKYSADLLDGAVEIEVKAFSLGKLQTLRTATGDRLAVHEVSGIVSRLGPGTGSSKLVVGDRVCGFVMTAFGKHARPRWTQIAKICESVSFETASCIPIACMAAYHAMNSVAHLAKNEKVLHYSVHTLEGQAALVISQQMGAKVYIADEDNDPNVHERIVEIANEHHIPAKQIVSVHDDRSIRMVTSQDCQEEFDVVFSPLPLSSRQLQSIGERLALFSRYVELCNHSDASRLNMSILSERCATYTRFNVLQLASQRDQVAGDAMCAGLALCAKSLHAKPSCYNATQIETASKLARSPDRLSAQVIVPQPHDMVLVDSEYEPLSLYKPNSTYLVVGGVSGISKAIILWMMEKGAKNILVISRTVEVHPEVETLMDVAKDHNCNFCVRNCDVANEGDVRDMLKWASTHLPPIDGVVNAAAALKDSVFERMTYSQWQLTMCPKVAGSLNLHKCLPSEISFFVMLSSVVGITGHSSQANYAAANTFQDALARHRVALGLAGTSLNLPAVTDVGMVAGDEDSARRVQALGTKSIEVGNVLRILENAIELDLDLQQRSKKTPSDAQVIVGLQPWNSLIAIDAHICNDMRFGTVRLSDRPTADSSSADEDTSMNPTALLTKAVNGNSTDSPRLAKQHAAEAIAARLGELFDVAKETVDLDLPLSAHGVDSLVAVELRNWFFSIGKAKLSIFDIMQSSSVTELGQVVLEKSQL